jgi:hypothetical protein
MPRAGLKPVTPALQLLKNVLVPLGVIRAMLILTVCYFQSYLHAVLTSTDSCFLLPPYCFYLTSVSKVH